MKITELDILYTKIANVITSTQPEIFKPGIFDIEFEDKQEMAINDLKVFIANFEINKKYPYLVELIQKLVDKKVELDDKNILWIKDKEFLKIRDEIFTIIEKKIGR